MRRTTITADEELLDRLRAVARRDGLSLAEVMRQGLEWRAAQRRRPRLIASVSTGVPTAIADEVDTLAPRAGAVALILDTGPLFAAIHADDRDHVRCAALLDTDERLVVPAPVLVETEWLVTSRLGPHAFDAVYADIDEGAITVADTTRADWNRIRALCSRYADLPLGLVDASVIALAERLGETSVATLDHRHFSIVRPRHVPALTLLPR